MLAKKSSLRWTTVALRNVISGRDCGVSTMCKTLPEDRIPEDDFAGAIIWRFPNEIHGLLCFRVLDEASEGKQ